MTTYRFQIQRLGQAPIFGVLSDTPRVIGRAPESDIVLKENCISRRHARLYLQDDTAYVEDLGSSNGVLLNGTRVRNSAISPTDQIQLGHYTIRIERVAGEAAHPAQRRTELEYKDVAPLHKQLVDQDHTALTFLYRLSQHMSSQRDLRGLLEVVLNEVMECLPAQRGYVLARGDGSELPDECISKSRQPQASAPPISTTLINHVYHTRSSVLTSDASDDERFDASDSIVAHCIKSAICTPLTSHDRLYGAVYVDADSESMPFTQTHLQLLSVVGQVAGAAIENVLLIEKQIHQERLAAIGQTVSATSHDMRNILTGIAGGSDMLDVARARESWEKVEKATGIIRRSMGRFENLVNSLLTYARKTEIHPADTDVNWLIREVLEAMEPEAAKHGIEIRVESPMRHTVSMDAQQVYRVLANLIKNAIDAMEDQGGVITIDTFEKDVSNVIRVRDTGPGMTPDVVSRVGQAFFTTKEGRGTGLGLAVSFRIMEQHHGRIEVESEPGSGSTFSLVFPDMARTTARFRRISI